MKAYLIRVLEGLSHLGNAILYPRTGSAHHSISADAWRYRRWKTIRVIDWLFSRIERDHCRKTYEWEVEQAARFLSEDRR